MASSSAEVAPPEGPVMGLMSKRLRALRKKYNRIIQTEERASQGKSLNKEQEEVLRSKPAVAALIDEYEKLRLPLSTALHDELSRPSSPSVPPPPEASPSDPNSSLEHLVDLLYFGRLFDVMPQSEFTATMLTRTHERGCCLTYDYVTDDATELLGEQDLDAVSAIGAFITSRPVCSGISHKNALQGCIQHARLWLGRSDQPIQPGASVTYAGLREKLSKIMASDYFTTTPEMKVPVDVAAAVGNYNTDCQVQIPESTMVPSQAVQIDGAPAHYHHEDDDVQEDFQETEVVGSSSDQSSPVDEPPKDESDELNPSGDITSVQQEQRKPESDAEEHNLTDFEQQYVPRRAYQNQRGGSRGGVGGRRGHANGGRGVGYQNGRGFQHYETGYHERNQYNTRGRGGRGSTMYNNHGAATHGGSGSGGRVPASVQ